MFLDDDMLTLQLMERIARYLGHETQTCSFPEQAMQMMVTFRPELVMVDMSLNQVNGLDIIRQLRGIEDFAAIPFVVVSAGNTLEDERLARAAGAVGYIQKPMGVDKLAEVVAQYVPNSQPQSP